MYNGKQETKTLFSAWNEQEMTVAIEEVKQIVAGYSYLKLILRCYFRENIYLKLIR